MDLNHARLPIPPRWQSELQCSGGLGAAVSGRPTLLFLQYGNRLSNSMVAEARKTYASFAVIEIFAFSTFDTGQPFSAASAYF
jgi:hypothetical protein